MELYLRYLEKYEKKPNENLPVGLILCAEKSTEVVELMRLSEDRIRIAEYWTRLIPKKVLQQKLQYAKDEAQREIEQRAATLPTPIENQDDASTLSPIQVDILKVCKKAWKSTREITEKTSYKRDRLRKQIKLLIETELLEYRYPQNPRHPKQKYRATKVQSG